MTKSSIRTVDLLLDAYKEQMQARRKYDLKDAEGKVLRSIYVRPLTRYDRKRALDNYEGEDTLTQTTLLLCQMAELEDGTKAFHHSDVENLQRCVPENVLNEIELFLLNIDTTVDQAKK